jgi:hypothetical protein
VELVLLAPARELAQVRAHRGAGRAADGRGAGWAVASSVTGVSVAFTMVSILGSCRS